MKDFETGRTLRDVSLELSRFEAEELAIYLARMLSRSDLPTVHMVDVQSGVLDKELTVHLADPGIQP